METIFLVLVAVGAASIFTSLAVIASRLQNIEYKQLVILRHLGLAPPLLCNPSERVRELALDPKKKIQAIGLLRKEANIGLREAKEVVEELAASKGMTHV